jgi:hypothetical protein
VSSDCTGAIGNIVGVIRSRVRGRDEEQRALCYDKHHVWAVTVIETIPDKSPCALKRDFIRKNFCIDLYCLLPCNDLFMKPAVGVRSTELPQNRNSEG